MSVNKNMIYNVSDLSIHKNKTPQHGADWPELLSNLRHQHTDDWTFQSIHHTESNTNMKNTW